LLMEMECYLNILENKESNPLWDGMNI